MMTRRWIGLLLIATMLTTVGGCGSRLFSTSAGRLEVTLIAYSATVDAIQLLADAGEISKEQAPRIALMVRAAKRTVDIWHARELAGLDTALAERAANVAVAELKEALR